MTGREADAPSAALQTVDTHYQKAFQTLTTKRARQAFEIGQEPVTIRERYGRTRMGQSCLLARRLVEAGIPFITVDDFDWDDHARIFPRYVNGFPFSTRPWRHYSTIWTNGDC